MPQIMQNDSVVLASKVTPSKRQLIWQKTEFYAFCHFGTNTFTGKEWGDGNAAPSLFNPKCLDAEQWVREIKNAGMRAVILTCKHHDGFCLWPSKFTDYSVKSSPFRNGKGDVVKEVSDACKKHGLKFGVYLSPWDRHEKTYGTGQQYNDYFINQLTELAENYGDIFCFWFDGACGEGKNGKKQVYDWDRYFALIREKQPNAVISICGPDVRWCGNEAGKYRSAEWSVVPSGVSNQDYTAENSQKEDNSKFRKREATEADLGSRKAIAGETSFIWYPCETDVSIRPGWFYHKSQDFRVKSVKKLDGLNTALPIGVRKIDAMRTLTTESLAVLMPFRVQEIMDAGGIFYGVNAISGNLILCNKSNLLNQSAFILGVPGSGKSFSVKELIPKSKSSTFRSAISCALAPVS